MPLILLVLFIVVPIVEIYVIIQIGQTIGVLPTIFLLVADAVLGTWLFRHEGRKTWHAFQQALQAGRMPAKEVADGALVIVAGALMLSPGFVTDVFGVFCLLPPTRALLRRGLTGFFASRMLGPVAPLARRAAKRAGRRAPAEVIDGEVLDPDGPTQG